MKDKVGEYLSAPLIDVMNFKPQFVTRRGHKHHCLSDCSIEILNQIKRRRKYALDAKQLQKEAQQKTYDESGEARSEGCEQDPEGNRQ